MEIRTKLKGVGFITNNPVGVELQNYIVVSYDDNVSTINLIRSVEYFYREGLKVNNVVVNVKPENDLQNTYGFPNGYINIDDDLNIKIIDQPYRSKSKTSVEVSFTI